MCKRMRRYFALKAEPSQQYSWEQLVKLQRTLGDSVHFIHEACARIQLIIFLAKFNYHCAHKYFLITTLFHFKYVPRNNNTPTCGFLITFPSTSSRFSKLALFHFNKQLCQKKQFPHTDTHRLTSILQKKRTTKKI